MKGGYLAKRYLYSEITARYHDSIRSFYYLVEVINALAVFYLADYLNRFAAVFFKQFAHVVYVLRRADEAGSDKVDFLLNSKENIAFVSFADIGHWYRISREVDAFVIGELSAGSDFAKYRSFSCVGAQNFQTQLAVVHQYYSPRFYVFR